MLYNMWQLKRGYLEMIEAKHVAIDEVGIGEYMDPNHAQSIFQRHHLESAQDLIDQWKEIPELSSCFIHTKNCVGAIQSKLKSANKIERNPVVFPPDSYQDPNLTYNDLLNTGSVLVMGVPTTYFPLNISRFINEMTIDEIRKQISYTNFKGCSKMIINHSGVGIRRCQKLRDAINMYHKQVERQAKLTDDRSINLFTFQQDEKRQLVKKNYNFIIYYLVNHAEEFIWGKQSDNQKNNMLDSIAYFTPFEMNNKERLISLFADYTTLPELEEIGQGKSDVLDKRFIKVKK